MKIVLWCLFLTGCLTLPYKVERVLTPAGRLVEVHTDAPKSLEPVCPEPWVGCYDGNAVFLRSPVKWGTRQHELAHADGMLHSPWEKTVFGEPCSKVIQGDKMGRYKVGDTICISKTGEYIY